MRMGVREAWSPPAHSCAAQWTRSMSAVTGADGVRTRGRPKDQAIHSVANWPARPRGWKDRGQTSGPQHWAGFPLHSDPQQGETDEKEPLRNSERERRVCQEESPEETCKPGMTTFNWED